MENEKITEAETGSTAKAAIIPETFPETEAKAKAEVETTEAEAEAEAETEMDAKTEAEAETEAETEAEAEAEAETEAETEAEAEAETETEAEAETETKTEAEAEAEAETETKTEAEAEAETETENETVAEAEVTSGNEVGTGNDAERENRQETVPETKKEVTAENGTETAKEIQVEAEVAAKADIPAGKKTEAAPETGKHSGMPSERQRTILVGILAGILTVGVLILGILSLRVIDENYGALSGDPAENYVPRTQGRPEYLVNGTWFRQKENVGTYLLIGIDKFDSQIPDGEDYRNNEQSDALFLLAVDRTNKTCFVLHLNRDTMANIPMLDINGKPYGSSFGQLALSHTYGSGREDSCENTVRSVSDYLYGLQIDRYASFSMDAVGALNDAIGGVTLTVSDDMTVIDPELIQGETVTLRGEQALSYVRSRQNLADSTNMERMKRQRQFVTAFLTQAKSAISSDAGLSVKMYQAVSDHLVSDMDAQELMSFSELLTDYAFEGILTVDGEARPGEEFMEFYADEDLLKQQILDLFYDRI